MNLLNNASRQKRKDLQANKCFSQFTHQAQWDRQVYRRLKHMPEPAIREFKTSHYNAQVKPSWMGKRSEQIQHSKSSACLKCGETQLKRLCRRLGWWFGRTADEFWKVKKASDKREGKNRKRCKSTAISGDTPADYLISLIDNSKLSKVPVPVSNTFCWTLDHTD